MFGKLLRNHFGGRRAGTPPTRSPRGTLSSIESKGKRHASASPGVALGGSSKKLRMGSFSTPTSSSTKPPSKPLPPPALKDKRGVPLKYSHVPSDCLHSLQSLEVEWKGNLSLVGNLVEGGTVFE
ncbi:UNVERIFIED_CONTAM: hypothetical protein Slati_4422600 [Sesamum latifolium]|uniref:Uncharacterized protein n=1 Tax=Sesamum latifolium TaxID=2727402 RepID=A0AAW2SR05_9LAMI